jgi:hypothetical protein
MEASFWNLWPHINKVFYQVYDVKRELVWDDPEFKEEARKKASVIVNLPRIESMVWDVLAKKKFG